MNNKRYVSLRIVSLAPSNTEILCALGCFERLVGVTQFCDHPEEVLKLKRLKGWINMNLKEILALEPDLTVTSTICQEQLRRELGDSGVNLFHLDPRTLSEVSDSFVELGKKVESEDRAKELVYDFEKELSSLGQNIPNKGYCPRLYCEEWHQPPMVSGNWMPELMELIGTHYFPIEKGQLSKTVTMEEIQAFDPEIIVLSICGKSTQFAPEKIPRRPGWEKLTAVQSGRIYSIDDSLLNRPGHRLCMGAKLVQQLIGESFWGWKQVDSNSIRRLK